MQCPASNMRARTFYDGASWLVDGLQRPDGVHLAVPVDALLQVRRHDGVGIPGVDGATIVQRRVRPRIACRNSLHLECVSHFFCA